MIRSREGQSRVGRGRIGRAAVLLALPQTYMNASGGAVAALCQKHGIRPPDICVVLDDIDLPVGTLRMRSRGSAGGQKGLASIILHLGTTEFPRLRVGIQGDRYSRGRDLADYVLEPFLSAERERFEESVQRGVEVLRIWIGEGMEAAMRRANRRITPLDRHSRGEKE